MKIWDLRLGLLLLAAGCSSGTDKLASAWKEAGLSASEWKEAGAKLNGGKCSASKVSGLEVTLCEFENAEAAKKGEETGFELLGHTVGASVAAGKSVLVVADSTKEDPSGRRMNEVINAFKKQMK